MEIMNLSVRQFSAGRAWTKESKDFRERAPAAAFENMYQGNWMGSVISGLASGVPGDVKGLEYLHSKYGVSRDPKWMDGAHV